MAEDKGVYCRKCKAWVPICGMHMGSVPLCVHGHPEWALSDFAATHKGTR